MKKLLQINTVANIGSTGRIAEGIGQVAIDNGWESFIAYGREANNSNSQLIKVGSKLDAAIHGLQTRIFDSHGLGSVIATEKLIVKINGIKPTIIHLHNIHGYYLNYKILFAYLLKSKIPVVWTLHDCWPFTGHCVYYDFVNCKKWQTECFNCEQKKSYPSSLLVDRSTKNFYDKQKTFNAITNLTLVPVSNWLHTELKKSFLKEKDAEVVHNGIDLNVFKPSEDKEIYFPDKSVILGVANDWVERKGFFEFKRLSTLISDKFIIVLIGLTPDKIKTLPKNMIGIEKTNNVEELVKYYTEAMVFFNPTYEDNFPTTNLESLSCGTPVITYDTGGSPEAIDSETGYIVKKNDINTVYSTIKRLEKEDQNKIKMACRKRAEKMFDKNNKFKEYLTIYNKILKNAKK